MPLVNNLLNNPDDPCPRWPLRVVYCRLCSLAQLTESPPPQAMFDTYLYYSSQSQTMLEHGRGLAAQFARPGQRVIEIASNDGYLLRHAQSLGATVLGIDPAQNIAKLANDSGVPTRCDYFTCELAKEVSRDWGRADVMFANNVLAHVPDPNEIAAGIAAALSDEGVAHIEVPYVVRMVQTGAFDTIYHEHHCYFSLSALKSLFNRHGLALIDVKEIDIHGGTLHVQLAHRGDESAAIRFCAQERKLGLFEDSFYRGFAQRVASLKSQLEAAIGGFATIAGYGAAAKGVVLLNSLGLDTQRVAWVADVSPHKQGKFIPGTGQRIVPPSMLLEAKPDAALLLPWNIRNEIIQRNQPYLNQGGRFIVPIPEVSVVPAAL